MTRGVHYYSLCTCLIHLDSSAYRTLLQVHGCVISQIILKVVPEEYTENTWQS